VCALLSDDIFFVVAVLYVLLVLFFSESKKGKGRTEYTPFPFYYDVMKIWLSLLFALLELDSHRGMRNSLKPLLRNRLT
jgi:hypothetical protein